MSDPTPSSIDLTSKRGKKAFAEVRKEIISELCRGYHSRGLDAECPYCSLGMEAKLNQIRTALTKSEPHLPDLASPYGFDFTPVKTDGSNIEENSELLQEATAVLLSRGQK